MKVSIVTAHYNSPEIARRQVLHYNQMDMTDCEVIFIDDGSDEDRNISSLSDIDVDFNFYVYETHDKAPWTQPKARNYGVGLAEGDYVICADIDHIIVQETLEVAKNPIGDVIRFRRQAAILDENGNFVQDYKILKQWGLLNRYFRRDLRLPPHGNSYVFKRDLFLSLGGVDERYCGTGRYPNREEIRLKRKLKELGDSVTIIDDDRRPWIYMMPNGKYCGDRDYNPFGYFHNLSRERNIGRLTNKQKRQKKNERPECNNPSA